MEFILNTFQMFLFAEKITKTNGTISGIFILELFSIAEIDFTQSFDSLSDASSVANGLTLSLTPYPLFYCINRSPPILILSGFHWKIGLRPKLSIQDCQRLPHLFKSISSAPSSK